MTLTYKLHCGSYHLEDQQNKCHYTCDQLALVYESDVWVVLKHGSPEAMEAYRKIVSHVIPNIQMVVVSKEVPVEEINNCLTNCTYIETFIKKYGGRNGQEALQGDREGRK